MPVIESAQRALREFPGLDHATVAPLDGGLINHTYLVQAGAEKYILQRVHPVFGPAVHLDIEAVTQHLNRKGMPTPLLVRTKQGELYTTAVDERPWRLMTFVAGKTWHKLSSPSQAEQAGALVARFHAALADLSHTFHFSRPGAHDTKAHFSKLAKAIHTHASIPNYAATVETANAILEDGVLALEFATLPTMMAHGDLKVSNLLFADDGRGLALVDLDTCARLPLAVELGDAFRSWCNPLTEDAKEARFDRELFAAAMRGYVRGGANVSADELHTVVPGVMTICLELASRFCADVFFDEYFGWDQQRFASRREHNLARARGQHSLFRSVLQQRGELMRIVDELAEEVMQ